MFICFLVIFLGIYISISNGTSNYKAYKKTELTKDAITRFENDVKNGKNINLENYIDINDKYNTFSYYFQRIAQSKKFVKKKRNSP